MATLSILNNFSLPFQGNVSTGKQGSSTGLFNEPFDISVTGSVHYHQSTIATATTYTIYDNDEDWPLAPVYFWYWADQITYIQLITGTTGGSGTNIIIGPITAKAPVALPTTSVLGAANTTVLTTSAPSVVAVDSVVIGNYSGSTANYVFAAIY